MSSFSMIVTGFLLFLIQWSVFPFLFSAQWQPDLWLTVMVMSTLIYDKKTVFIWAVAGGIIQDLTPGSSVGFHLFSYLVIASLFYWGGRRRFNRHWYVSCIAVMAGTLLGQIIFAIVAAISGEWVSVPAYIAFKCAPLMLVNGLAAICLHRILWSIRIEGDPQW